MSYLSKYTGARIDELLGKCDELPSLEDLSTAFDDMQDADLSGLTTTATATTRSVRATLGNGTVKSVSLPAATTAAAGMMSAADKKTVDELGRLADITAPFLMDGMKFVWNQAPLAPADITIGSTFNASSTGNAKKLYDRFMKGIPGTLLVPMIPSTSALDNVYTYVPFILVSLQTLASTTGGRMANVVYRATGLFANPGYGYEINVIVNYLDNPGVQIKGAQYYPNVIVDTTHLENFQTDLFSIKKDGTLNVATRQTLYSSSTGDAKKLYDRLQKGFPPALMIKMTNSDDTVTEVWLTPAAILSGKTVRYESCSLGNGTITDKKARIMVARSSSSWSVQAFLDTAS